MAAREKSNLLTPRTKIRVITDSQSIGVLLYGTCHGAFDGVFASGLDHHHLESEPLHRDLRQADVILHKAGVVWIDKERDARGAGKQFMQQLHPFGDKLDAHETDLPPNDTLC